MSRFVSLSVLWINVGLLTIIIHRDSGVIAISPILSCALTASDSRVRSTHLVLVFSLDEERKGKSHLGQLGDAHAILGTVKLWGVVVFVD